MLNVYTEEVDEGILYRAEVNAIVVTYVSPDGRENVKAEHGYTDRGEYVSLLVNGVVVATQEVRNVFDGVDETPEEGGSPTKPR